MQADTDIDVSLLEDILNEPHCESQHAAPGNKKCFHKVVATVFFPCGCKTESCIGHVLFLNHLKITADYVNHGPCGATYLQSRDIVIIPKG